MDIEKMRIADIIIMLRIIFLAIIPAGDVV
jgi:hypothetical protein